MPYVGISDAQVITAVLHGNPPNASISPVYLRQYKRQWDKVKQCWSTRAEDRPTIFTLFNYLYSSCWYLGMEIFRSYGTYMTFSFRELFSYWRYLTISLLENQHETACKERSGTYSNDDLWWSAAATSGRVIRYFNLPDGRDWRDANCFAHDGYNGSKRVREFESCRTAECAKGYWA